MPKANLADALSRWQKPVDNFQTSALDFYTAVEVGLKERELPDIKFSRVKFRESGVGSAERVYLRVKRKGLFFDIGAAPFGTGYFFSWWMARSQPSPLLGVVAMIVLLLTIPWFAKWLVATVLFGLGKIGIAGALRSLLFARPPLIRNLWDFTWLHVLAMIGLFTIVRKVAHKASIDFDGLLSAVPILGPVYKWLFARETYYTIDTMLMYQSLVSAVVTETVDTLTTAKGLRALTEDEKKPIMRDFLKRNR